jgi:hypothetical protein
MEVIRLPTGQPAPPDVDCIGIDRLPDGGFNLNATALLQCDNGAEAESVSLIGAPPFATVEEAEAAGLAWAAEHCVARVYITLDAPLPE